MLGPLHGRKEFAQAKIVQISLSIESNNNPKSKLQS